MEIKIDHERIAQAINDSASKALESSLGGYEVQKAIASVVTSEIAEGVIAQAMKQAIASIDTQELTQHLATEIQRATTKSIITMLHEALTDVVCKLRGTSTYGAEGKAERAQVKAELFAKD